MTGGSSSSFDNMRRVIGPGIRRLTRMRESHQAQIKKESSKATLQQRQYQARPFTEKVTKSYVWM